MELVEHHGRSTAFRRSGRSDGGATLVFVHGSGGDHAVWKAQLARLASDFEVVALDLSGHGDSEDVSTESGPQTLDAYTDDVLAVAEETDADVLVGNSLGGAVVQHLLLEREFEPEAAILVGSGARLAVLPDLLDWLESDFDRAVEFLHDGDRLFHDPDERYVAASTETMYDVGPAVTSMDFRTCNEFDVRDRLDEISVPVLAVTGEYDQLTPPRFHEYLAEEVPDGRWETIPDAAHLSMLERPVAFNGVLRSFLDDAL